MNPTIHIETGCLDNAGAIARQFVGGTLAAIVSDDTVFSRYGSRLEASLKAAGWDVVRFVFPHGEARKNLATYGELLSFLAEQHLTRTDVIFALGGGVTGDLAGFAAATYLRGVGLVQIPTSLLACVDSSVGGKTAVDLPQGKNLAGAFYPPHCVVIDPALTHSLPEETFRDGMAEVIKYAAILDGSLYDAIDHLPQTLEEVISRCVALKDQVVAEDLRDNGLRQLLNFGHTFGHAIEKQANYTLGHGVCVAMGMAIMARACAAKGLCSPACQDRLLRTLTAWKLPTKTAFAPETLFQHLLSDKKRRGQKLTLVVLRETGRAELTPVSLEEALDFLKTGWEA